MDLNLTYARWKLGNIPSDELVDVATEALVAGFDSPSLIRLAGLHQVDIRDAHGLFERSCAEFGLSPLSKEDAARLLTRYLAAGIAAGELDPEDALGQFVREVDQAAGLGSVAPELNELSHYVELSDVIVALVAEGLAGAIYTQTTDVEVEVNGLLTYDRAVFTGQEATSMV